MAKYSPPQGLMSHDDVLDLLESLEAEHRERHDDHRRLRDFWKGNYWNMGDAQGRVLADVFKDLRHADLEPRLKLVHNVLQQVCVKFQTYLSPLPQNKVYIDPPGGEGEAADATLKERYLYGVWHMGNMAQVLNRAGWYLPLMGDCFQGIWPDLDRSIPVPLVRSPEHAYPIQCADGSGLDAIVFKRHMPRYQAERAYGLDLGPAPRLPRFTLRGRAFRDSVEIIEYSDTKQVVRYVDGQKVSGEVHGFGFNLFDQMQFIHVPDEAWGSGAVEQSANLVHLGNMLYSLMFEATLENVFPELILIDPTKFDHELDRGAGATIGVNPGGDAKYLQPPVEAIGAQAALLGQNEQNIKQGTGMPDVNFGQFRASIITGKAVDTLQDAGTGSTVEMVQGLGIGQALVSWNEKAIVMAREMFAKDTIRLYGTLPRGMVDVNPEHFALTLKGADLKGSTRNDVVFMPYLNMHEKVVMGLQMAGGGLVSKKFQRDQVGIVDSQAMDTEILREQIEAAVTQTIVGAFVQAGAQPDQAVDVEQQAEAFLAGQTPPPGGSQPIVPPGAAAAGGGQDQSVPAPGPDQGGGGGYPPVGPGAPGAPGELISRPLRQPDGSPPPATLAEPVAPSAMPFSTGGSASGQGVTRDQVANDLNGLSGIKGRVFLVGAIVDEGSVSGDVEVAVTKKTDEQAISDGAQQYTFTFIAVRGTPSEPYIEVTPGKAITPGGGAEAQSGNPAGQ